MKALYQRWLELPRALQIVTFCLALSVIAGIFAGAAGQ